MITTELNGKSKKNLLEFKSIKTKMTTILIVMLIASGTILTGIAAFVVSNELESAEINHLMYVGDSTSRGLWLIANLGEDIASILSVDEDIRSVLLQARDGTLTPEEQLTVSENLADITDTVSDVFERINVVDNQGIVIASSFTSNIGRDDSTRDVVSHQHSGSYIGDPYIGTGNTPRIPYARAVYADSGEQIGLVYIALNLPEIDEHLFSTPGLSDDSTNFLVGLDGTLFSGVNGDYSHFLNKKFDLSIFPAGVTMVQAPGFYGNMEYIVKTPVPGTEWTVITTKSVEVVKGPIMSLIMMMVASLLIVLVAGGIIAIFIGNGFARPIQNLAETAEQLALGIVDVDITYVGSDEIGSLANAFRHIVENTKERVDYVTKITAGDINFKINAASDEDVEGKALIEMMTILSYLTKQLHTLANNVAEGNLSYRTKPSYFQGVYRELLETLNKAFDLITTPVQETMRLSISYSSGNYSDRFDPTLPVNGDFVAFKDALNQIGINSSNALLKVKHGVDEISEGTSQSSTNVEDIAAAVATLAESSSRVSSLADQNDTGLDQALIAMNDLANTVGEVAGRTSSVSALASQSSDLALDGVKRAEHAGEGMEEIMRAFELSSKSVSDMSSHMDEIGGIVGTIAGIAEQTSLLALNAAIEAARAGDAGLGFAVVADEVKSLAQESQISAEHIRTIIGNLQRMSADMTTGFGKATSVMQSGNNAVKETVTIFRQMAEAISDVNQNMSEVAAASEEQAASVQEITASMSMVRDMVQDTTREATDSAAAAEEISASLDELKDNFAHSVELTDDIVELVNEFKIE